ncbi:MAG: hypothetical protein L0H39_04295, partial [Brachybacterium sp.]|nr:hypothetical protein [Brachybacterium sp.]
TDSDGLAEATLVVPGATLPLTVRIDDGDARTTDGALSLHDGEHTLTLQDADGQAIAPVTVTVPEPLRLEAAEPVDDKPGTWYVELDVRGGTPPYRSTSGTVVDGHLVSESAPLSETLQLEVTDAAGCTAEGEYSSGHAPCDLPCDGEAVREGFRFWIPQPIKGTPINGYDATVGHFHLTDPEGAQIDLTEQVQKIIGRAPESLSVRQFAKLVENWLDQITTAVAEAVGSPDWFTFDYAPAPKGALHGTLLVGRLSCLGLSAEISVDYQRAQNKYERQLQYTADGTTVSGTAVDGTVTIPPFDVVDLNRCRPEVKEVPRCSGTDREVSISWSGNLFGRVKLTPKLSGTDRLLAGVWEVPTGRPALSDAEQLEVEFDPDDKSPRWVRLTIYTASGCEVSDSLDLGSALR